MNSKTTRMIIIASTIMIFLVSSPCVLQSNTTIAAEDDVMTNNSGSNSPIKHLIVIFQENVSFDHYFATYPNAANLAGEPSFHAKASTPSVNGLTGGAALLTNNPNSVNPFRIPRSNASTCTNDHLYSRLQESYNGGLVDKFVETNRLISKGCSPSITMGYFDGNTVTALWNYAQHFSMSDNFFASTFGPSTPGHLNLISGQTHGANPQYVNVSKKGTLTWFVSNGTLIGDPNPMYENCPNPYTESLPKVSMKGTNIGDLLNRANVTWGYFQGGFKPTEERSSGGNPVCGSTHGIYKGIKIPDYIPHHQPFQYYETTANPNHLRPTSVNKIGHTDQANHQYDLSDFWAAADSGHLPSVSFLKAPAYQDGHAGYSNPLEEQTFIVNTINRVQQLPEWNRTAIVIAYDDSDGWYDHVMPPIISKSDDPKTDALLGVGDCGKPSPSEKYSNRCGYGPRLPFLIISPYAKVNYVDHNIIDQASILKFIEDNWNLGRIGDQSFDVKAGSILGMFNFVSGGNTNKLVLDPSTGAVIPTATVSGSVEKLQPPYANKTIPQIQGNTTNQTVVQDPVIEYG
jgi:phospholipase C